MPPCIVMTRSQAWHKKVAQAGSWATKAQMRCRKCRNPLLALPATKHEYHKLEHGSVAIL